MIIASPFLTGYATDVWVQRETTTLAPSGETVFNTSRITGYLLEAGSINRLSRISPAWRKDAFQNLQNAVNLTLKFELRATSAISQLLRSLLSLYNISVDSTTGIETQTWEADFTDQCHTLKIWIKDRDTGKVYLHEGCAVADCTISMQARGLPTITFSVICLKTTPLSSLVDPGTLFSDRRDRPNFLPQFSGAFWASPSFGNEDIETDRIRGLQRMALRIQRDLSPVFFNPFYGTRFEKSSPMISGSMDVLISSLWFDQIATPEVKGQCVFRFAQDDDFLLQCDFQNSALTFDQTSLHSSQDSNAVTMTVNPIQDLTVTSPILLSLTRIAEGFDGGEIADNDIPQIQTLDGGNFTDDNVEPSIHGGKI